MKRTFLTILCCLSMAGTVLMAQNANDSTATRNIRTGWTFGVLPSVAFDADLGFQYGALTNIYYFGDGSTYPEYLHSIYAEAAYTTNNYGLLRLSYDSRYLIPNHRLSLDLSYLPDAMCDFLGFNGYNTILHPEWVTKGPDGTFESNPDYITRAFYKMQRDIFRLSADLQGDIAPRWYWNLGLGVLNYKVGAVDVDRLNGNKDENLLPDTTTLFDIYRDLGLIKPNEAKGGFNPYVHAGVTFDTRDRQNNPRKGIHADAFFTYSAGLGDQVNFNNLKFNAAWRHYIPLLFHIKANPSSGIQKDQVLTLAYRAGVQMLVAGESPFYANTYMNQLYMQRVLYEGLGGANSVRGIMRNRILANGFAYGNIELRAQVAHFKVGKENFYIGLNPFLDGGMVLQPMDMTIDENTIDSQTEELYLKPNIQDADTYGLHLAAGCGIKIAMNDNFILSVDWARSIKDQDNYKNSNLYIKMGYMF